MQFNKGTGSFMCDRCGKDTDSHKMSWFNKQDLCPSCQQVESNHPRYKEAKEAVLEHERSGDMNWEGIGLPEDLIVKKF